MQDQRALLEKFFKFLARRPDRRARARGLHDHRRGPADRQHDAGRSRSADAARPGSCGWSARATSTSSCRSSSRRCWPPSSARCSPWSRSAAVMYFGILTWLAGNFQFIAYIGWSTFWSVTIAVRGHRSRPRRSRQLGHDPAVPSGLMSRRAAGRSVPLGGRRAVVCAALVADPRRATGERRQRATTCRRKARAARRRRSRPRPATSGRPRRAVAEAADAARATPGPQLPAARAAVVEAEAQLTAAQVQDARPPRTRSSVRQGRAGEGRTAPSPRSQAAHRRRLRPRRADRPVRLHPGRRRSPSWASRCRRRARRTSPAGSRRINSIGALPGRPARPAGDRPGRPQDQPARARPRGRRRRAQARSPRPRQLKHTDDLRGRRRAPRAPGSTRSWPRRSTPWRWRSSAKAQRARQPQRRSSEAPGHASSSDLAAASRGSGLPTGQLLWPADGPLDQGVGPRVHPVYGYRSCHTGIDIGAGYGATISRGRSAAR